MDQQDRYIQELLNLLSNPNYRHQQRSGIVGPDGVRITDNNVDDTTIDTSNNTQVDNLDLHTILECGHCSTQKVGGRCHFCDGLVCTQCINLCFSCRLALCPSCSVIGIFDGQSRIYCHQCAEDITRSMRMQQIKQSVLSFIFEKK